MQEMASLQRCLEAKIFNLECCSKDEVAIDSMVQGGRMDMLLNDDEDASLSTALPPLLLLASVMDSKSAPCIKLPAATAAADASQPPCVETSKKSAPCLEQEFSHRADGSFHLTKGVIITAAQAEKILRNKKATLVVKDTAQAIWTAGVLVTRSVSGNVAPKLRVLGEARKQPLTPEKVDVIAATLQHWGQRSQVEVTEAVRAIPRLLTEKIQDCRKSLKKQVATSNDTL
ncbi:uncharacterized protein LOC125946932 [Dermacentor silvarum]|uniref:uncharacterized protein LOC125946932 n=1 Tax=Dermacentor silvarum TaxID=543639 RepID=UPI0021012E24|nr:uncharacterized protein LOC125946932 [Dermacentor silvarum]